MPLLLHPISGQRGQERAPLKKLQTLVNVKISQPSMGFDALSRTGKLESWQIRGTYTPIPVSKDVLMNVVRLSVCRLQICLCDDIEVLPIPASQSYLLCSVAHSGVQIHRGIFNLSFTRSVLCVAPSQTSTEDLTLVSGRMHFLETPLTKQLSENQRQQLYGVQAYSMYCIHGIDDVKHTLLTTVDWEYKPPHKSGSISASA